MSLKVRQLSYAASPSQEINDINFTLDHGEILAVLGRNGAGQELLLNCLADPELPYRGEVVLNQLKAKIEPLRYRQQISYLPMPFTPDEFLTGFEYLELVGASYALAPTSRLDKILTLAKQLDCTRELYTTLERLDNANRQKIGLIAAFLPDTAWVFLAEPTAWLDLQARHALAQLITDAQDNGQAIILATQDIIWTQNLAHRFLILKHGELAAEGTLSELAHSAQTSKELARAYLTLS